MCEHLYGHDGRGRPRPVPNRARHCLVRERYGFERHEALRATGLTGERDENFKLTTDDGAA